MLLGGVFGYRGVAMGTPGAADDAECEISIGPFRLQQDHEKMNVNVKSLVSMFEEHEDGGGDETGAAHGVVCAATVAKQLPDIVQCSAAEFSAGASGGSATAAQHQCMKPEKVIDDEDPPVTLLAVKRTDSKSKRAEKEAAATKDAGGILPDRPHFIKNNIVTKYVVREKIGHDLRRCYSDSWGTYGLTDDASLLEALKDVIDKPQAAGKGGKGEKKSKRIRLPKKPPAPTKPFQEQVKDIFNPDKAQGPSPGTSSSDSENDSEHGWGRRNLAAKPPIGCSTKCKGSCEGNYSVVRAAGGFGGATCPVCHCSLEERGAASGAAAQKKRSAGDGTKKQQQRALPASADVVNIVLVETTTQQRQWPPPTVVKLEAKPPKIKKRRNETIERKVFEVRMCLRAVRFKLNAACWFCEICFGIVCPILSLKLFIPVAIRKQQTPDPHLRARGE